MELFKQNGELKIVRVLDKNQLVDNMTLKLLDSYKELRRLKLFKSNCDSNMVGYESNVIDFRIFELQTIVKTISDLLTS